MISALKAYPAYKESGTAWLGEVPAHWEVRRLRTVVQLLVSNVDKHQRDDEHPVRLCNYVDVYKRDRIRPTQPFMRATATSSEIRRFLLRSGDVLITKDSESWDDIAVPALVDDSAEDLLCGYHLAILRPTVELVSGYLFRALQAPGLAYQFHVEATGVTRYGLSHAAIKAVRIPLPPVPEQRDIVRYLDYMDRRIRRYIRARERLIGSVARLQGQSALVHEYRTRLIADLVTGKLDVREASALLPYEPEEDELLDEVELPEEELLEAEDLLEPEDADA